MCTVFGPYFFGRFIHVKILFERFALAFYICVSKELFGKAFFLWKMVDRPRNCACIHKGWKQSMVLKAKSGKITSCNYKVMWILCKQGATKHFANLYIKNIYPMQSQNFTNFLMSTSSFVQLFDFLTIDILHITHSFGH